MINIAIDGPAGSGKSSTGEKVAEKLKYQFIDTGLTYRAFTWFLLENNVNFDDIESIRLALGKFSYKINGNSIYINDKVIKTTGNELYSDLIINNINKITGLNFVRDKMVEIQRSLADNKGVVMVGRDITSVVLPNAELKIYLTATLDRRAQRRFEQNQAKHIVSKLSDLKSKIEARDLSDSTRKDGPLRVVPDAFYLDNSNMSFTDTVEIIYQQALQVIKTTENSKG